MDTPRHPLDGRAEKYQGEFLADQRHGRGTCVYPDGSRYTGEWAAGSMHGEGRYEHANGDVFVGRMHRGQRLHGKLRLAASEDEYDGEFLNDMPDGQGTRYFAHENVMVSFRTAH